MRRQKSSLSHESSAIAPPDRRPHRILGTTVADTRHFTLFSDNSLVPRKPARYSPVSCSPAVVIGAIHGSADSCHLDLD
jgi:hypothetical protein